MKLAFCLYKYFPFGGLQRDFLSIATLCHEHHHSIRVYTLSWQGKIPDFIDLRIVPIKALQNHRLYKRFQSWVQEDLKKDPVDKIIGFNKMPELDVYYAADSCYIAQFGQPLSWYQCFNGRFKQFYRDEKAVFNPEAKTKILLLTASQKSDFQRCYHTPDTRFTILPPGIARDRVRPMNAASIRAHLRLEFSIKNDDILLLMVGSGFKTKGLDRALEAIAALPPPVLQRCQFIVIGQDKAKAFVQLSQKLNIANKVQILSGRTDIPRFLVAADLLLHPAYQEAGGIILLEALVAGLPVLTTDVCGYAPYISAAGNGIVIHSPFEQNHFNALLLKAIQDENLRAEWQHAALSYAQTADLFGLVPSAVKVIEGS
ncbi:MAG: glycosyltransferase family 4 protein [Gammaproteobacteria bacterium]|nr:glycosyltransferase family 4 protein [Gammaproteobacteria bacterium]